MYVYPETYDVIVVGAGHAGSEAAAAAANLGMKTLLITMDLTKIAQMSCNPAMGGIAKGQIVREIDALGGYSGIVADLSAVQFRMLNRSKGPAMWSPRTQNDRTLFTIKWREQLEKIPGLELMSDMVTGLHLEKGKLAGVRTKYGLIVKSRAVILTAGTFLNGKIFIGPTQVAGGRIGEPRAQGITEHLVELGFEAGRMKTGTPPRVDARSLDFSKMEEQKGDEKPGKFSFLPVTKPLEKQLSCWITYTNPIVHETLRFGFDQSPLFSGEIQGAGPRYCPSIEDKIVRFADRERHQLFVEPEGWNTYEMYVNGFSTSLPIDVQTESLRRVPGFENVKIIRYGYAIEYDYFPPTQLKHTLETKLIDNLYFAGQINGTTGYEEAAAQGIMAGINAALKLKGEEPFILGRDQAYIGVLIDDLVTKGTDEPYRMFTSRAEFRTLLRQDNADLRLTPLSYKIGLASEERMRLVEEKKRKIQIALDFIEKASVKPEEVNPVLEEKGTPPVKQGMKLRKILSRPQLGIEDYLKIPSFKEFAEREGIDEEVLRQIEIDLKYAKYIEKEKQNAERMKALEDIRIPEDFDFRKIPSLSNEGKEKLSKIRPRTLGQASRISGVSASDIQVLLVYMGR
ncbi:MAG: tRNA uridine-5-carboxymethylaminomethyl(34) synthesis enzyme MnmG [Chlorobi bacterium]|nr:tRNA uridine-5-carboxymethylaminomethyl(34) synthesis enzyme MnmG [Chlorobiota bacterium]